ncbi:Transglycosylase SLT domain-containing protein [Streptomyces sp. Ag82_O1-12]|uniref:transglycosylase SLT domain-containing protein n=1 Tax=unclassified Streptomyces TaxID=2593676 RepID=UPI000BC51FFA|nr:MULTISPECIES: transglycosylase SLT domain-containing protein [unclassified Streptomyces]SMQ15342.1 Transglycosylase SLT domain-containing protein [Streptomyces sp. Ag82_O1-12]SOD44369.1 Transglycosylase SLT domain-containing protein [Streptomyces sp. Ag82_G6-1]
MPKNIFSRVQSRSLTRHHKIAMAGVATLGAVAIGVSAVPSGASTKTTTEAAQPAAVAYSTQQIKDVKASVTDQMAGASLKAEQIAAKKKADAAAAAKKKAAAEAAKKKAEAARQAKEAASRAAKRAEAKKVVSYPNNLDGWIRESLSILKKNDIPASYDGIHRNIMRESSGNPKAINNWDINAINGIPSKGLLQVIPPTFKTWHVPGTSWDIYDPVANITAACNYAADKYGSMDNVDSAY